jgi:hypothetical protein
VVAKLAASSAYSDLAGAGEQLHPKTKETVILSHGGPSSVA